MKTFLTFFALGCALPVMAFATGQTTPLTDPKVIEPADKWLRCKHDPGRVFRFEHQRRAVCSDRQDKQRERDCTMWKSGVMLATREKDCA